MIELDLHGCRVLFTGARQGDLRDRGVRDALAAKVGRPLALGRQVHGSVVARVGDPPLQPQGAEADGQATSSWRVAPTVLTADCLPVALVGRRAVAMVHAGWRGLSTGVLEAGIRAVEDLSGGEPVEGAAIGPGAGACCYEVGDELRELFGTSDPTLDMKAIARRRLNGAGVDHVEDVGVCTICDRRYFSFRRDGEAAGRQAGTAWLTS